MDMNSNRKKPVYIVQAETNPEAHYNLPFGLMFIGKALMNAGWKVKLFHLFPGRDQELYNAIKQEQPLFLGVSSMIGSGLRWLVKVSKDAHRMGVPVVWGGPFASMVPEVLLREDHVMYVVVGEAEKNIAALAEPLLTMLCSSPARNMAALLIARPRAPRSFRHSGFHRDIQKVRAKISYNLGLLPSPHFFFVQTSDGKGLILYSDFLWHFFRKGFTRLSCCVVPCYALPVAFCIISVTRFT